MPNSTFWKEPTISIAQAFGMIGILFISFEFYYNSDSTTKEFSAFKAEEKIYREEERSEAEEAKGLTYKLNNETKSYLNGRINNRVDPLEEEMMELIKWKNYRQGYLEAQEKFEKP